MYLVIECCDREVSDIKPARDAAESVKIANEMLEDHLETIGYPRDEPDSDSLRRSDPEDGESDAWCNLKDMKFDAFRVALGSDGAGMALDILLKEFCKSVMSTGASGCCDGACDDCPVNGVLEMLANGCKKSGG